MAQVLASHPLNHRLYNSHKIYTKRFSRLNLSNIILHHCFKFTSSLRLEVQQLSNFPIKKVQLLYLLPSKVATQ